MITRYECDRCGEENRGQPAAYTKKYSHMCAGCFDEYCDERQETTA